MKYKTTIEVTPDQIQAIVKAHFEKQGKNVEKITFDVSLKYHSDYDGGYSTPTLNKCDVVVFIEDGE
jgi:hypothetical protein